MLMSLFYRNNFPAQQQLFCKSRSSKLLPFRRPDPGAGSESQAVGEHLLHEVILQTHSWYVLVKILFISRNDCLSSKPFPFFTFVCVLKVRKSWKLMPCQSFMCISHNIIWQQLLFQFEPLLGAVTVAKYRTALAKLSGDFIPLAAFNKIANISIEYES